MQFNGLVGRLERASLGGGKKKIRYDRGGVADSRGCPVGFCMPRVDL